MLKRILEVFGEPITNGGQESLVFNVIQNMDTDGLHIDVLTLYYCKNKQYEKIIETKGGRIISLGLPFKPGKSRNNLYMPLLKYLESEKYDVLHSHSGSISVLALSAKAAQKAGIKKIIVHSHCAAEKKTLKYRAVKFAMSFLMNSCPTDYIACSRVAGEWKYSRNIVDNKLKILKNGVDLEKFAFNQEKRDRLRAKFGFKNTDFVIGHVGRFSYQKNQEFLIKIFKAVKEKEEHSKLLLIGDGETLENVKKLAKDARLDKDVFFIGNTNSVNDYLQIMDVFVLPSRYEGLPIAGIEAQASGLPTLVSENVSNELGITDCVQYLNLENEDAWIKAICEQKGRVRQKTAERMRDAGYDIKMTAANLRNIYLQEKGR